MPHLWHCSKILFTMDMHYLFNYKRARQLEDNMIGSIFRLPKMAFSEKLASRLVFKRLH